MSIWDVIKLVTVGVILGVFCVSVPLVWLGFAKSYTVGILPAVCTTILTFVYAIYKNRGK